MDDRDQATSAAACGSSGDAGHGSTFDLDALARATAGDQALQREVLEMFSTQVATTMGALHCALLARDAGALHCASHSLLGSCLTLGATRMAALLSTLERSAEQHAFETAQAVCANIATEAEQTLTFLEVNGLLPPREPSGG